MPGWWMVPASFQRSLTRDQEGAAQVHLQILSVTQLLLACSAGLKTPKLEAQGFTSALSLACRVIDHRASAVLHLSSPQHLFIALHPLARIFRSIGPRWYEAPYGRCPQ